MFNLLNGLIAMAPPPGQQGQGGGGGFISMIVMFGAIILVFYFLIIRPQQKRQKEHQKMIDSIKKGDKVITTAGMHGTVVDVEDNAYVIQIADNVRVKFEKSAVAGVPDKK